MDSALIRTGIPGRVRLRFIITLLLAALLIPTGIGQSSAAAGDIGSEGASYSGVTYAPTSDKPQSKMWWNAGSWWADMWSPGVGWTIHRLNTSTDAWVNTGVVNDVRANTLADTLWDGTYLYIASHVVTLSSDSSPTASVANRPAYLYRYTYANGTYTLDSGFPSTITTNSSESLTIDKDSTGAIWATWTQVSLNTSNQYINTVYVNASTPGGSSWSTPFVIPTAHPNPAPDDISAVVAFGGNKIGVMWSDQKAGAVYWAVRTDGTSKTSSSSWLERAAASGLGQADDHINLKSLQADASGRVYAAVKTGFNDTSSNTSLAQLILLVYKQSTGAFTVSTIARVSDCVSRPQVVLDTQNSLVRVFHTAPSTSVSGCAFSGVSGSIYEKTASMDNPVFVNGRGTAILEDADSPFMNDVTTSKQSVNSTTGIAILAGNSATKRYWHSYRPLGPAAVAPTASFTATPTSGTAPLDVQFTDTSTGSPTSWSWSFGDGTNSTSRNPSHTYTAAGTYNVTLTATNSAGSTTKSTTITVTAPVPPPAPTASFTATPTSGTAPLNVQFTDTSAGSPTSWSWSFGDGTNSTSRNPSHTYTAAGTYSAKLTATNSSGTSTSSATTITVNAAPPPPTGGDITVVNSSSTGMSTATTAVTLARPTGAVAGDVLVASITADANPSATAPAGWTTMVNGLSAGSGARVFAYYRVVAAGDAASYTWTLSSAVKWGAGITAYRGVDTTTPLASTVATATDSSYNGVKLDLPSITTTAAKAMLIGGIGLDSGTAGLISPPTNWTQDWSVGGQAAAAAHTIQTTAGATGIATFTLSSARAIAGWRTALKPAAASAVAPTASFTATPTSGTAPLNVQFTDTSTGTPTSWSWSFGDGDQLHQPQPQPHLHRGRHLQRHPHRHQQHRKQHQQRDHHHRHRTRDAADTDRVVHRHPHLGDRTAERPVHRHLHRLAHLVVVVLRRRRQLHQPQPQPHLHRGRHLQRHPHRHQQHRKQHQQRDHHHRQPRTTTAHRR